MPKEKVLQRAKNVFEKIKIKAEIYEMLCNISGYPISDIISKAKLFDVSEFLEFFLTIIKYGYKHNNDYIKFLELYRNDIEFKLLLAEKCISYKNLNRHYMHFIGDLFYENYLSFDDFKLIVNLYFDKAKAYLIILVAYCKDKIQEYDINYWNDISKIAFENADESFNDFMYTLEDIGDDGKITDENAEFFSIMVGKKMFVDVFYDRLDEITGKDNQFFVVFNKPHCFNYSPFSFSILNGSMKCMRNMILNMKEENFKKTTKFAKLCIKGGNIEAVRVLQEFVLKRDYTPQEVLYALKCKRYDIARWMLTTSESLTPTSILDIKDSVDLYFVSQFFDLAPYLLFKTDDYESTVVICETSKVLPQCDSLFGYNDYQTFSYLLAKNLLNPSTIFPSTISHFTRLKLMLTEYKSEIVLKKEYIQNAIVSGRVNCLSLLMQNGLKLTDVDPETILCCGISSGSTNMVKFVMDYVNFSQVNFMHLTKAFRYNGLDVVSLVFSKCNNIQCLKELYKTFENNRIAQVFYNRLLELGFNPNEKPPVEEKEYIDYSDILSDSDLFT